MGYSLRELMIQQETARLLARKLKSLLCHVNVIHSIQPQKFEGQATAFDEVDRFKSILENNGIPCTVRLRRGVDRYPSRLWSGQLASEN